MKKTYLQPKTECIDILPLTLIADSQTSAPVNPPDDDVDEGDMLTKRRGSWTDDLF